MEAGTDCGENQFGDGYEDATDTLVTNTEDLFAVLKLLVPCVCKTKETRLLLRCSRYRQGFPIARGCHGLGPAH